MGPTGLDWGAGRMLPRTRTTSCIVGLSIGCLFVHKRASWKTFLASLRSLHVAVISGSTVSITALLAVFDKI